MIMDHVQHPNELTIHIQYNGLNASDLFKSLSELLTKHDLKEMEQRMAIKLSELATEVKALRTQVVKIWGEQQAKYDALVVKYGELEATLANVELTPEAQTEIDGFKAELTAFDDTIPDVVTPPVG